MGANLITPQLAPPPTRVYRMERQANGRYTFYDIEAQKPHEFKGDVFDAARCQQIIDRTQQRMPVGRLFVGHGKTVEKPVVGKIHYSHNPSTCLTSVNYVDVDPRTSLEIFLGMWPGRSIEYEYPSFEIIEGMALLGASRQFFDDFSPVEQFELSNFTEDQLRQDANNWPATAVRSAGSIPPACARRGRYGDDRMNEAARNVPPPAPGAAPDPAAAGAPPAMDLQQMVEDLVARVTKLEGGGDPAAAAAPAAAPAGAPPARAEDADEFPGDDDKKKDERGLVKEVSALRARADAADEANARAALNGQIDADIRIGKVVDKKQRERVVESALRAAPADRRGIVEDFLRNNRTVALADVGAEGEDAAIADDDPDKAEFNKLMAKLTVEGRNRSRELSKMYDEFAAEDNPVASNCTRSYFINANLDKTDGVHFANRTSANR